MQVFKLLIVILSSFALIGCSRSKSLEINDFFNLHLAERDTFYLQNSDSVWGPKLFSNKALTQIVKINEFKSVANEQLLSIIKKETGTVKFLV